MALAEAFIAFIQAFLMVGVAQLVKASDCDSEDRRFKSALSPQLIYGRVAEWFKAPSWKGGEGNTSASSNLVSSSIQGCRTTVSTTVSKTVYEGSNPSAPASQ